MIFKCEVKREARVPRYSLLLSAHDAERATCRARQGDEGRGTPSQEASELCLRRMADELA